VTGPFGDRPVSVLRRPGVVRGSVDLDGVVAAARSADGVGPVLLVSRCAPTAAFSRRDTLLPGYDEAVSVAGRAGFEPVVRPVGGHLAAYDAGSLVLHLWGPHPDPRRDLRARFELGSEVLADALRDAGVPDVRVGPVPGEYCDGEWSVNAAGRGKLVGTGQRLFRQGFLFCAVVSVGAVASVRDVLSESYAALGLPLDPDSVDSVDRWVPGVHPGEVAELVAARVAGALRRPTALPFASAAVRRPRATDRRRTSEVTHPARDLRPSGAAAAAGGATVE
jgi:octanoyl-[GcvH]:protein N-octanoyltransferase